MSCPIKIIVNGYNGKMGHVVVAAIADQPDLQLVAKTGRGDNLAKSIQKHRPDVVIDFTQPNCVFINAQTIVANHARPVIGTTGLTTEQIAFLSEQCRQQKLGGIVAPNFSLGAVLMMKFAQEVAKFLPEVEIVEMHHQEKLDAPSGTAIKTAEMISTARSPSSHQSKHSHGAAIHSIRLPGLFAHQSVIFGGLGETLTIRHDALDRNAMMPGLFLACRKVMELNYLVYGLDRILW